MSDTVLTISSKNYSSWSLRGWLLCRMAGLDFEEEMLSGDDPGARPSCLMLSPSFLVPWLTHNGIKVWDTLAIAEYLHETVSPGRASAQGLRGAHPLPLGFGRDAFRFRQSAFGAADEPQGALQGFKIWAGAQADIDRVDRDLARMPEASMAGPICSARGRRWRTRCMRRCTTRFRTYDVKLDRQCADYCETIQALPDMIEWIEAAKTERAGIEELEAEF